MPATMTMHETEVLAPYDRLHASLAPRLDQCLREMGLSAATRRTLKRDLYAALCECEGHHLTKLTRRLSAAAGSLSVRAPSREAPINRNAPRRSRVRRG